jgi:hypothetical protein
MPSVWTQSRHLESELKIIAAYSVRTLVLLSRNTVLILGQPTHPFPEYLYFWYILTSELIRGTWPTAYLTSIQCIPRAIEPNASIHSHLSFMILTQIKGPSIWRFDAPKRRLFSFAKNGLPKRVLDTIYPLAFHEKHVIFAVFIMFFIFIDK